MIEVVVISPEEQTVLKEARKIFKDLRDQSIKAGFSKQMAQDWYSLGYQLVVFAFNKGCEAGPDKKRRVEERKK